MELPNPFYYWYYSDNAFFISGTCSSMSMKCGVEDVRSVTCFLESETVGIQNRFTVMWKNERTKEETQKHTRPKVRDLGFLGAEIKYNIYNYVFINASSSENKNCFVVFKSSFICRAQIQNQSYLMTLDM